MSTVYCRLSAAGVDDNTFRTTIERAASVLSSNSFAMKHTIAAANILRQMIVLGPSAATMDSITASAAATAADGDDDVASELREVFRKALCILSARPFIPTRSFSSSTIAQYLSSRIHPTCTAPKSTSILNAMPFTPKYLFVILEVWSSVEAGEDHSDAVQRFGKPCANPGESSVFEMVRAEKLNDVKNGFTKCDL